MDKITIPVGPSSITLAYPNEGGLFQAVAYFLNRGVHVEADRGTLTITVSQEELKKAEK
jgi:hypothetical protein